MARWSAEDAVAEVEVEDAGDGAPATPAQVPVARAPRQCPEPALLAA
jgi:hypothetical protein